MQVQPLWKLEGATRVWTLAARTTDCELFCRDDGHWYLGANSGHIDIRISDSLDLQVDLSQLTATCYDADTGCAYKLKFTSRDDCRAFDSEYNNKLYANLKLASKWNGHQDDDIEHVGWDLTLDDLPEASARPYIWRSKKALSSPSNEVYGVVMGEGQNSFLLQKGQCSVLQNKHGSVEGTNRSVKFSLPQCDNIIPGKAILAQKETEMRVLTPDKKGAVLQVSPWNLHHSL